MIQERALILNLVLQSNFPRNTADRQGGGGGGAAAARATASHTSAGTLASLSCTSGRKHFIDCYSSSYTPPSSEKSSNVLISSW